MTYAFLCRAAVLAFISTKASLGCAASAREKEPTRSSLDLEGGVLVVILTKRPLRDFVREVRYLRGFSTGSQQNEGVGGPRSGVLQSYISVFTACEATHETSSLDSELVYSSSTLSLRVWMMREREREKKRERE